jgi:hypothetical protein
MVWSKMKTRDAPVLDGDVSWWQISVKKNNLRSLQQLFDLRVVGSLDLFVVQGVLFLALMVVYLEAMLIKTVQLLLAANIRDGHIKRFRWSLIRLRFTDIR